MNHYRIAPEDFIQAWQSSATLDEVVKKTGVPTGSCYSKAAYYRSMGVPLKHLVKRRKTQWAELSDLAASLQEQTQ